MRLMKQSRICIATTGLHDSIGWKFAEYVVAGRTIVIEPLNILSLETILHGKLSPIGNLINTVFITSRNGLFFGFPLIALGSLIEREESRIEGAYQDCLLFWGALMINMVEILFAHNANLVVEYSFGFTTFLVPLVMVAVLARKRDYSDKVLRSEELFRKYIMGLFYLHPLIVIVFILFVGVLLVSLIGVWFIKRIFRETKFSR